MGQIPANVHSPVGVWVTDGQPLIESVQQPLFSRPPISIIDAVHEYVAFELRPTVDLFPKRIVAKISHDTEFSMEQSM
jgi:hypothetical protein